MNVTEANAVNVLMHAVGIGEWRCPPEDRPELLTRAVEQLQAGAYKRLMAGVTPTEVHDWVQLGGPYDCLLDTEGGR